MQVLTINEERCKSCGLCIRACPRKALSFQGKMNATSYIVAECDREKCILCGICYTVCPDGVFEIVEEEAK